MIITRPEFTCPVLVIDDFFTKEDADACLQECIDLKPVYRPASVGNGRQNRRDSRIRMNDVVMMDNVFGTDRNLSKILSTLDRRIYEPECKDLWHKGDFVFDIINYATWRETVLSRYGKCHFYGSHQDTKSDPDDPGAVRHRIVTIVLYLNTEPEQFTGGSLTIYKDDRELTVKPKHNRAVVFPSFTYHKVENVQLAADAPFSAGRFSLNHWLGFR